MDSPSTPLLVMATIPGLVAGGYCGLLIAEAPGSKLYLSWAVSCLLAGAVGLAFYRGLYIYIRQRARSPLIMLVASLGILLAITAATADRVRKRAPSPARRFRKPALDNSGREDQGLQCVHARRGHSGLSGNALSPQEDVPSDEQFAP